MRGVLTSFSIPCSRDVLNDHLEGVETELDWLQQQLTAGGLNIDNSTLLNVRLGRSYHRSCFAESGDEKAESNVGSILQIFSTDMANFVDESAGANPNSQVVQYQDSSFFDLMDDVTDEENLRQLEAK